MAVAFKKVAIVGVGLIGGSFGMAYKRRGISGRIVGYGRSPEKLQKALELGAIDFYQTDFAQGWEGVDLVLLATPVGIILPLLRRIAPHLQKGVIVSDVGSIKGELVREAEKVLGPHKSFVGAHPIAGTEKSGVEAAFPGLFEKANCIITPTENTDPRALAKIRCLWQGLGSEVLLMGVEEHDFALATVSHLPHVVAYSLVNTVAGLETPERPLFALSGGGFRDFTRIAESDPVMWRDISIANRENLCRVIDSFQNQLKKMRGLIANKDGTGLQGEFIRAQGNKKSGLQRQVKQAAVFLDRDGTINEDVCYLKSAEELDLIPGALEAINKINRSGLKTVVITNQSAIGRGYLSKEGLEKIHHRLKQILAAGGAYLDGIYYCPHHPRDNCDCRKPATGMLLDAAEELKIDLAASYMVGDKLSDILLGKNLGLTTVLVLTGFGEEEKEKLSAADIRPDHTAQNLEQAVNWILNRNKEENRG